MLSGTSGLSSSVLDIKLKNLVNDVLKYSLFLKCKSITNNNIVLDGKEIEINDLDKISYHDLLDYTFDSCFDNIMNSEEKSNQKTIGELK